MSCIGSPHRAKRTPLCAAPHRTAPQQQKKQQWLWLDSVAWREKRGDGDDDSSGRVCVCVFRLLPE